MLRPSKHMVLGTQIVAVAGAYYLGAFLGLRLALVGSQVTPLWPPTGIAVASLLLLGVRVWPGITLGALAVNIPLGPTAAAVGMISIGNTLAPVCACLLLARVGFRLDLERLKDSLALVFLGACFGMLISATVGTTALVAAGKTPLGQFWSTWSVWWAGDAMGVLIIAPLLLMARKIRLPQRVNPYRVVEAVAVIGGTFGVTLFAVHSSSDLLFLPFPFLIWGALRFHQAGALPAALTASVVATLAAAQGSPPFAEVDLTVKMINLQAFNASVALTALILAAITAERDNARRDIEVACGQLSEALTLLGDSIPTQGRILDLTRRFPDASKG